METLATWLAVAVALVPIVIALSYYLPPRVRFVREATSGQRFVDAGAGPELFALRAMSRQPLSVLSRVSRDPVAAWRRGDVEVVTALADLELRSCGLRPQWRDPDGG